MRRPNLNLSNQKNAELFIATDSLSNLFKKAEIMSPYVYERYSLSYHSMKRETKEAKKEEFARVLKNTVGDTVEEWKDMMCEIHFKHSDMGDVILVDAGFFTVLVYLDKNEKFRIKYKEVE